MCVAVVLPPPLAIALLHTTQHSPSHALRVRADVLRRATAASVCVDKTMQLEPARRGLAIQRAFNRSSMIYYDAVRPRWLASKSQDAKVRRQLARVHRSHGERADSVDETILADRAMHAERIETAEVHKETLRHITSQKLGRTTHKARTGGAVQRRRSIADRQLSKARKLGSTGVGMHTDWGRLNRELLPEVAILGHANCGKSSLLNALCGSKSASGLANVSPRAGWTAELSFYRATVGEAPEQHLAHARRVEAIEKQLEKLEAVGTPVSPEQQAELERLHQGFEERLLASRNKLVLVDTPGYGFTVGDQKQLVAWGELIADYLNRSPRLTLVVLLVDAVRGLCPADIRVLRRVHQSGVPVLCTLTKADLLLPNDLAASHSVVSSDLVDIARAGATPADVYVPKLRSSPLMLSSRTFAGVQHFWKVLMREVQMLEKDERFRAQREAGCVRGTPSDSV